MIDVINEKFNMKKTPKTFTCTEHIFTLTAVYNVISFMPQASVSIRILSTALQLL